MNTNNCLNKEEIFQYSFSGDIKGIQKCLDSDPQCLNLSVKLANENVNTKITPIFLAAIAGQVETVKILLEKGACCKYEDSDLFTWTCLCPIEQNREKILDLIFTDENRKKIHKDLPLIYKKISQGNLERTDKNEVIKGMESVYSSFLSPYNAAILSGTQANLSLNAYNKNIFTSSKFRKMLSLELATYRAAIYELLKSSNFDLSHSEREHRDLIVATQLGDLSYIKSARSKGVNLSALIPYENSSNTPNRRITLAYLAAAHGHLDVLKYLKKKCNIDLSLSVASGLFQGKTPAYFAASNGHVEVLKYLKKCDIDLALPLEGEFQGYTLAYASAVNGHVEVLKYLKEECYIDLSLPLEGELQGYTLAYIAAACGHVEVLKYLNKECGVNLSNPLTSGKRKSGTPKLIAAVHGHVEVLKYLKKECGVDLSAQLTSRRHRGDTLGIIAAAHGNVEVLKYLKKCGSDLSAQLTSGERLGATPAFAAG